jgi:phospholipid/cholesterol/gamma-HCH transport system ATP-binding protein
LNTALGASSIVVTYDVSESLKIADYVAVMAEGRVVAHGPTAAMREADDPFVKQFLNALPDGPVPFHYPAPSLAGSLELG